MDTKRFLTPHTAETEKTTEVTQETLKQKSTEESRSASDLFELTRIHDVLSALESQLRSDAESMAAECYANGQLDDIKDELRNAIMGRISELEGRKNSLSKY